jgi:hypothetical protein
MMKVNTEELSTLEGAEDDHQVVREKYFSMIMKTIKLYVKLSLVEARKKELKEFRAIFEKSVWPVDLKGVREVYRRCGYAVLAKMQPMELMGLITVGATVD